MADLCAKPSVKNGEGLLDAGHITVLTSNPADAALPRHPRDGAKARAFNIGWLVFLSLVAIAGVVMAAYCVSKIFQQPTIVLTSNMQQATDRGWVPIGNLYAGTGYWSPYRVAMGQPRSDHGSTSYQGKIYVFGGTSFDDTGAQVVLRNITRYNMYNGTYDQMPLMPDARYRFGYAVISNRLYIFGGFNRPETSPINPVGTTMVYDLDKDVWLPMDPEMVMTMPRADIGGAGVASAGTAGKAYAIGGYENTTSTYDASSYVEELDVATGRWQRVASMSIARGDVGVQHVNGLVYAMGGVTTNYDWVASMEAYDPNTGKWTQRASMEHARGDFATEVLSNGNILAAGGEGNFTFGNYSQTNQVALPWVEEYLTGLDIWVPKAALYEPRFRFDMASDNGVFAYAFGGADSCNDASSNQADTCHRQVLSSIFGYFDVPLPNIFAARV